MLLNENEVKLAHAKYNQIKNNMPRQNHQYVLVEEDCTVYGNTINHVALYFKCSICNCLLLSPCNSVEEKFMYKFNIDYSGFSRNDIVILNEFLTCNEIIIKNIIE